MRILLLHVLTTTAILQLGQTFNAELDVVSGGGLTGRLEDLAQTDVPWGGGGHHSAALLLLARHGDVPTDTPFQSLLMAGTGAGCLLSVRAGRWLRGHSAVLACAVFVSPQQDCPQTWSGSVL